MSALTNYNSTQDSIFDAMQYGNIFQENNSIVKKFSAQE